MRGPGCLSNRLPEPEAVCVCGHPADQHQLGGSCQVCQEPPCRFFYLRFWRETVSLARRSDLADPVGQYWRDRAPMGSDAWIFSQMTPYDRSMVAVKCWEAGRFDNRGRLACVCPNWERRQRSGKGLRHCEEEWACDLLAVFACAPLVDAEADDLTAARLWGLTVSHWRFRRLVQEAGYAAPVGWLEWAERERLEVKVEYRNLDAGGYTLLDHPLIFVKRQLPAEIRRLTVYHELGHRFLRDFPWNPWDHRSRFVTLWSPWRGK